MYQTIAFTSERRSLRRANWTCMAPLEHTTTYCYRIPSQPNERESMHAMCWSCRNGVTSKIATHLSRPKTMENACKTLLCMWPPQLGSTAREHIDFASECNNKQECLSWCGSQIC